MSEQVVHDSVQHMRQKAGLLLPLRRVHLVSFALQVLNNSCGGSFFDDRRKYPRIVAFLQYDVRLVKGRRERPVAAQ